MSSATGEDDKLSSPTSVQPCKRFTLAEIESATENFDDQLVIGRGGFGKVYKGQISSEEAGHVVAIKRFNSTSNQGEDEFRAEIETLSKLRHCHLVSLIGYCDDSNEMILVYEYMPNGTLYYHLHQDETTLSWVQRMKTAIGAGRGLDYLHTGVGTREGIIHRDVKSSNILLDEYMEAKISDFGLSKIGPTNQSSSWVDASVKGTFGYLDPEYFYTKKLSRKTDTYAFGVVLFELLTGRLAVDERHGEEQCSLVKWAKKCVMERKLDQMVDTNIKGTIFPKCLTRFAQIANRCVHNDPKERPTMTEVVALLQAILELQLKSDNSVKSSGKKAFTWKIHKYRNSVPNEAYPVENVIPVPAPAPTAISDVSANVLEEALNGTVPTYSLALGKPVSRKVGKQCAHFYSVRITEEEAKAGIVCRVQSAEKSKFKLLYFERDENGGLNLALQEDSAKKGKVTAAGMYFLGFPVYKLDQQYSMMAKMDPDTAFFRKLEGFQPCEITELTAGVHTFAVYGDNFFYSASYTIEILSTASFANEKENLRAMEAYIATKRDEISKFETEYAQVLAQFEDMANRYTQEMPTIDKLLKLRNEIQASYTTAPQISSSSSNSSSKKRVIL